MTDISVLLPPARLMLFSNEAHSVKILESLAQDWRYARVITGYEKGGVDAAIARYTTETSPDLLIIQTDQIDANFTKKLADLATHCAEGTDAVIIGPDNDVQIYRQLIDMGVSDYLVHPVDQAILSEIIAKTLLQKLGVSGSKLIVTIGAQGGSGVSTLSQGLALGSSQTCNQKTLLIDAAGGWSVNSIALGIEPSTTIAEASKAALRVDQEALQRMILPINEKLSVLATGSDILLESQIDAESIEKLLNMVMCSYPIVIFDASGASASVKKAALLLAHKIYIISTPAPYSLRLARTLLGELHNLRVTEEDAGAADHKANFISLILNFVGSQGKFELATKDIEQMLGHDIAVKIDFMPDLFSLLAAQGKTLSQDVRGKGVMDRLLLPLQGIIPGINLSDVESKATPLGVGGLLQKLRRN